MGELRTVLGTPAVPRLLGSSLAGRLPTAMATLAALLLVRGDGGSYLLAGTLAALFTVGTAVGQPLLARVVDRRGQFTVLLGSATVSTAAFVALGLTGAAHPVPAALAATVAGLATPPLEPCLRALWPRVVPDGAPLRAALSLDVGTQEIVFVTGPLLTVAAVSAFGHVGGVYGCALFGLVGTAVFALTPPSQRWRPTRHEGVHGTPLRHAALRRIFLVASGCAVPVGALPLAAAAYAQRHGSSSLTGWALAANAAGALTAGLYGAARPNLRTGAAALTGMALALAAGYLPLALPLPVAGWLAACWLSGLALPVVLGLVFSRIQLECPPNLLTEANAWVITAFGTGAAAAAFAAGLVTDHLAPASAVPTVVLGAAVLAATVAVLVAALRPVAAPATAQGAPR